MKARLTSFLAAKVGKGLLVSGLVTTRTIDPAYSPRWERRASSSILVMTGVHRLGEKCSPSAAEHTSANSISLLLGYRYQPDSCK